MSASAPRIDYAAGATDGRGGRCDAKAYESIIHALVVAGGIAALCSGCLVEVATNQNQPVAVAVDAGGVYRVAPGPVTDALTAGTAGRP